MKSNVRMANILNYKGYKGSINKEEGYYWGEILGLKDSVMLYEGRDLKELKEDFIDCVEDYCDFYKEISKE